MLSKYGFAYSLSAVHLKLKRLLIQEWEEITTNIGAVINSPLIEQHNDAVEPHHRFEGVLFKGEPWDLSHLEAFAHRLDPGLGFEIDVVVLFSCHCFTHSFKRDSRDPVSIPADEIFDNGRERRVLDKERYSLSKLHLAGVLRGLEHRKIQVANAGMPNFMTFEFIDELGVEKRYAIFFEATKDKHRKKRVIMHVQSAYILDVLTQRQQKAGKVTFKALLKAVYEGRKIRG